jgi:VanZ family protein
MRVFLKYWLPVLIWLGVIFVGSTEVMSAEQTSRFLLPFLRWLKPDISPETFTQIHFLVRKLGHVGEYAILALLLWRAVHNSPALHMKLSVLFGVVLLGCAVFAASDEFHQSFVKSRTSSIRDVLLDIVGAVIGLLIGISFAHRHPKKTCGTTRSQFVDARL